MRQISINRVKTGDVLGRTIYSSQGRVLLGRGIILTPPYIARLRELGFTIIYIDDNQTKDVKIDDVVSDEHRREALVSIELSSDAVRIGKDFSGFEIKKAVNNIVEDVLFQKEILLSLMDMRSFDTQTFSHAVSVCVLSTVLGKAMNLDRENMEALAVGALLHDIGSVKLPKELVSQRTPFGPHEQTLYESHTQHGFDILRAKRELNLLSAHIAFQHHEHLNGSGYPRRLTGNHVHQLAQIVGIADFFDNLVNEGPGHGRTKPHEACEIVMGSAGKLFSYDLVKIFLRHVAAYPTGCTVKLNTGEVGVVVDQNNSLPMRPVVRVLAGDDDLAYVAVKEYNLVEDRVTFIDNVLD